MEFLYFQETENGDVYVGTTVAPQATFDHHRLAQRKLVGVMRASAEDEKAIHRELTAFRVGQGASTYHDETVWQWIEWLVYRGYLHLNEDGAAHGPQLPYGVWRYSQRGLPYQNSDGQMVLAGAPSKPAERIALAHQIATISTLSDEYYTPPEHIELFRKVMGGIDTDPASCAKANEWIRASTWYTKEIDGLNREYPWWGNVWLNPPYGVGESRAELFIKRLLDEIDAGNVKQAITCLNVQSTTSIWFDSVWKGAIMHLFWRGRIAFIFSDDLKKKGAPNKGTILSYFGTNPVSFLRILAGRGKFLIEPQYQNRLL